MVADCVLFCVKNGIELNVINSKRCEQRTALRWSVGVGVEG